MYGAPFTLVECRKILRDHPKWQQIEMSIFLNSNQVVPKKSRTSESTSHEVGDTTHFVLDLNNEAGDLDDVEVHEVRPMGRDMTKKKALVSAARSQGSTSVVVDRTLYDALLNKWSDVASPLFSQRHESSASYLKIKERELELEKLMLENEERMEEKRNNLSFN